MDNALFLAKRNYFYIIVIFMEIIKNSTKELCA
jgi:hypothetical protein